MNDKRFIFYLDILGFTELVDKYKDSPEFIYRILDSSVWAASFWSEQIKNYNTLSFSDTILFWQEEPKNDISSFLDLCAVGSLILTSTLALQIPVRGIIVYNDLHVKLDSEFKKHQIFWGKGLIEAYQLEKHENWMGISVSSSALEQISTTQIEAGTKRHDWLYRAEPKSLLLNPFRFTKTYWNKSEKGTFAPFIYTELKAARFILNTMNEYKISNDYTGRVASKYFNTANFIKSVLEKDCYDWLMSKAEIIDVTWSADEMRKAILE